MKKSQQIRELIFQWHRYLGLVIGILIASAGLTGSVMIVLADTSEFRTITQIEPIIPQATRLSLSAIANQAEVAYKSRGEFKVSEILPTMFSNHAKSSPALVTLTSSKGNDSEDLSVMVNSYTGMLGEAPKTPLYDAMDKLHVNLVCWFCNVAVSPGRETVNG